MFAWHFDWLLLCLSRTFLLLLYAWLWSIWSFPVHFRTSFLFNFNGGWSFKFFVLLYFSEFRVKSNRSLIILEQRTKINFLEKFPLSIKSTINISLILFKILDELIFSKIEFLILAAKRVELVGGDREVIDYSIVLKLELVVILLEFLDEAIDENGEMLRFISDWCFELVYLFRCWLFFGKLVYLFLAYQFLYVFCVDEFIYICFELVFEQVQYFCFFQKVGLDGFQFCDGSFDQFLVDAHWELEYGDDGFHEAAQFGAEEVGQTFLYFLVVAHHFLQAEIVAFLIYFYETRREFQNLLAQLLSILNLLVGLLGDSVEKFAKVIVVILLDLLMISNKNRMELYLFGIDLYFKIFLVVDFSVGIEESF